MMIANRFYKEFEIQNLKLDVADCIQDGFIENIQVKINDQVSTGDKNLKWTEIVQSNKETFSLIMQDYQRPELLNLNKNETSALFSVPVCYKRDGTTQCKNNCNCLNSTTIGTNLRNKGCVFSFYQMSNYLIGSIVEQATDPMTKVAIELDRYVSIIFIYDYHTNVTLLF